MRLAWLCLLAACSKTTHAVDPDAPLVADASVDAPPVLPACTSPGTATFTVDPSKVIAPQLVGFGAQFNGNLYAQISANAGVTPENVVDLEAKAVALAPRHVR